MPKTVVFTFISMINTLSESWKARKAFIIQRFGLNNIYSGKVHDIHKYNVKIIGTDSKPVAYLDHFLDML